MFLHEDKAYCFEAVEFQTVPGANTDARMSKWVQWCCQCLPPAASAMKQHCTAKAQIYSHKLSSLSLYLLSQSAAKPVGRSAATAKPALGKNHCLSPCCGPKVWPQQGGDATFLVLEWTHQHWAEEQLVENNRIQQQLDRKKFEKVQN